MAHFDEKALVQKLDKILCREFGTNLGFKEFSAGYGIADLVFAKDYSFLKKNCSREPITNFLCLKLFLSLKTDRYYTKEMIIKLVGSNNKAAALKQLKFLVNNGYLQDTGLGFSKTPILSLNNPIQKVIAIEVKLKDHKGGLCQAKRYQYFADESYLAILKDAEKNINFHEFNQQNIGLILFDPRTNKIEIKHPKRYRLLEKSINTYAKELMLGRFMRLAF